MAMPLQLALGDLPTGFRFHPTDEELVVEYLRRRAAGQPCPVPIIADVDIYKFDPWELPSKAWFGEREWYFFTPRDRKYPNGVRPNRSAASGFWKATGTDKLIHDGGGGGGVIGVKKALVFYVGRAPRGTKTPWIMHEYRLALAAAARPYTRSRSSGSGSPPSASSSSSASPSSMRLDEWVLCRIFSKPGATSPDSPLLQDLLAADAMTMTVGMYAPATGIGQEADGSGSGSLSHSHLPALQHCLCQQQHTDRDLAMAAPSCFGHQDQQQQMNNALEMINLAEQQIIDSMLMDQPFFGDQPCP